MLLVLYLYFGFTFQKPSTSSVDGFWKVKPKYKYKTNNRTYKHLKFAHARNFCHFDFLWYYLIAI